MEIWVNGIRKEYPSGVTVSDVLDSLSLKSSEVAVEVNTRVVKKAAHAEQRLASGDKMEIVTFVGGG